MLYLHGAALLNPPWPAPARLNTKLHTHIKTRTKCRIQTNVRQRRVQLQQLERGSEQTTTRPPDVQAKRCRSSGPKASDRGAPCVDKSMVCTAARSTARRTVSWPSDDPQTTAEPARVVAKLVIGDGVVTTQRRPPFSDHNASVVDAATTTEASTSKIASFVDGRRLAPIHDL